MMLNAVPRLAELAWLPVKVEYNPLPRLICKMVDRFEIRNFRRLLNVKIAADPKDTVLVGPNNSGKTSATAIFRCFLGLSDFQIHDFSVSKIAEFDRFGVREVGVELPNIELDIWFKIDPDSIAYGRAVDLLPDVTQVYPELGIRLAYGVSDSDGLIRAYREAYPGTSEAGASRSLSQFMAQERILKRYCETSYNALHSQDDRTVSRALERTVGQRVLSSLLKVNFIDAQRNIDDEEGARSTKLSAAFSRFYRKNLERPEIAAEAQKVIDENNEMLTKHYEDQFADLFQIIRQLGVPSLNDRDLKIVSNLEPEKALQDSTDLLYIDKVRNHALPELYNGLGFKNLIYIAIQIKNYHSQWLRTKENRPLYQLIFIEEPEVHLHAQVQQTFIRNIWQVIVESIKDENAGQFMPQFVISTHSSHILEAVDFDKVRYFRRCSSEDSDIGDGVLNETEVMSLTEFKPSQIQVDAVVISEGEISKFLRKYLKLTHCDLFFADGAILVEGAAEKILLPSMINAVAPKLNSSYISILEVGGAFIHRLEGLMSFLKIPRLIITDLDSVSSAGRHPACRGDSPGAITSNATLKSMLKKSRIDLLTALPNLDKTGEDWCIAFQTKVSITSGGNTMQVIPRTFEESLIYENFDSMKTKVFDVGLEIPNDVDEAYTAVYEHVKSGGLKKTDFALSLLASNEEVLTPRYIEDGLSWLERRLNPVVVSGE